MSLLSTLSFPNSDHCHLCSEQVCVECGSGSLRRTFRTKASPFDLLRERLLSERVVLRKLSFPKVVFRDWLFFAENDRFTRSISLWCGLRLTLEVGGGLVIQQAHRLEVSCYGWLDSPGLESDPILCFVFEFVVRNWLESVGSTPWLASSLGSSLWCSLGRGWTSVFARFQILTLALLFCALLPITSTEPRPWSQLGLSRQCYRLRQRVDVDRGHSTGEWSRGHPDDDVPSEY
jgi:hypothetical protein